MYFRLFIIALPIFFAIDMTWLGLIARNFYHAQIGHLMKPEINWIAAVIFYLIFLCGLTVFVITPAMERKSLMYALIYGAFFGFVTYATYDLTNLAVTKDWPLLVTIVDLIWGAVLSALVASLTYIIAQKIA